jgi:hypothetical protein
MSQEAGESMQKLVDELIHKCPRRIATCGIDRFSKGDHLVLRVFQDTLLDLKLAAEERLDWMGVNKQSDSYSDYKPHITLGIERGGVQLSDECLNPLRVSRFLEVTGVGAKIGSSKWHVRSFS